MKTILIPVYAAPTALRLLLSDVLALLLKRPEVQIVLAMHLDAVQKYQSQFGSDRVRVLPVSASPARWYPRFLFIARFSAPTHSLDLYRRELQRNGQTAQYLAAVLVGWLSRSFLWQRAVRFVESRFRPATTIASAFDHIVPDLLVAPTLLVPDELALAKCARRRGVPVLGILKSWDSATTKGALRFFPDRLLVNNRMNRDEAVRYFGFPAERITVVGFPQFDVYARPDLRISREEFCKKLGLDPQKKILLYAPAGDWMTTHDVPVLQELIRWVESGEFGPAQILIRQNPGCPSATEHIAPHPLVVHDKPGTYRGGVKQPWESIAADDIRHLLNTLTHSDAVINWASTLTLEAALLDRPLVWPAYDGDVTLPELDSVYQMYRREHMVPLVATGAAVPSRTPDELRVAIHEALDRPEARAAGREKIREWIDPRQDGLAGERVAAQILFALDGSRANAVA